MIYVNYMKVDLFESLFYVETPLIQSYFLSAWYSIESKNSLMITESIANELHVLIYGNSPVSMWFWNEL